MLTSFFLFRLSHKNCLQKLSTISLAFSTAYGQNCTNKQEINVLTASQYRYTRGKSTSFSLSSHCIWSRCKKVYKVSVLAKGQSRTFAHSCQGIRQHKQLKCRLKMHECPLVVRTSGRPPYFWSNRLRKNRLKPALPTKQDSFLAHVNLFKEYRQVF